MYLHKTKNGHYTPPCCYFSGELEVVEILRSGLCGNDFHPIEAETRNKLLRDENGGDSDLVPSREIEIGKNCFIGCNSIVLKGTVLGDGCVVGAGAVVAGKFEDNCVIAGNPAKVIKRLDGKVQ